MDQFLGAPVLLALPQIGVLSLYLVVPLGLCLLLLRKPEQAA
jgi:ABC-2 type transport system permease protein